MKQIGKGPEAFCFRAFQFHDVVQRVALRRFVEQKQKDCREFSAVLLSISVRLS